MSAGQKRSRARPKPTSGGPRRANSLILALDEYSPEALRVLAEASIDSPGGSHRTPSLALLWVASLEPSTGEREALVPDLPRLLARVRRSFPVVRSLEDCWLADPRLVVRWPIGLKRFRIHPGPYNDPLQLLRVVQATAWAVDEAVLDRHGFSLSDLVEAALAYQDWRLAHVAPSFPDGELPRDRDDPDGEAIQEKVKRIESTPVSVTDNEIAAAHDLTHAAGTTWTNSCRHPSRAASAWGWATISVDELELSLGPGSCFLGRALAVRADRGVFPVATALVLGAVAAATVELSSECGNDADICGRLQMVTEARSVQLLNLPSPPGRRAAVALARAIHETGW